MTAHETDLEAIWQRLHGIEAPDEIEAERFWLRLLREYEQVAREFDGPPSTD